MAVEAGYVAEIRTYPFKGTQAVNNCPSAIATPRGIEGDRVLAAYSLAKLESGSRFPFVTAREDGCADIVLWESKYNPETGDVSVKTSSKSEWLDLAEGGKREQLEKHLTRMYGGPVVIREGRPDRSPISLTTVASLNQIEGILGSGEIPFTMARRVRTNLIIDGSKSERDWIGTYKYLAIGMLDSTPVILELAGPIKRCSMISFIPGTTRRDTAFIEHVQKRWHNKFAIHTQVHQTGILQPGMPVHLLTQDEIPG